MYYPNKYDEHNESLDRFIQKFDSVKKIKNRKLSIIKKKIEDFRDDGCIKDHYTEKKIIFDWEKRDRHYPTYPFTTFDTLGQFERKLKKEEILLSIQCSTDESAFCAAWHEDLLKEKIVIVYSKTESGETENTPKRFTKKFKEYKYDDMGEFFDMIQRAFEMDEYNSKVFDIS